MATAQRIDDREKYPDQLVNTVDGLRGRRHFRVYANSIEEVHAADGLPVIGQVWDGSLTRLRATKIDPREERKGGGWWIVPVDYETDDGQIPQLDTAVVTRVVPSTTTRRINFDITGTKKLTSDGRGVPRIVTVTVFELVRYFTTLPDLAPYRNITDEPKVNQDPVTLPNLFGSGQSLAVDAGQLLYAKYTPDVEGDRFLIRSELHWRRSWKHEKRGENPDGTPTQIFEELDIYELGSFAGLL